MIEFADDGFVTVRLLDADGSAVEKTIDVYEVSDRLAAVRNRFPAAGMTAEQVEDYYAQSRDYLAGLGLPRLSARGVEQLWRRLRDRIEDLRGKDQPPPSSAPPDSADSTASGSAA